MRKPIISNVIAVKTVESYITESGIGCIILKGGLPADCVCGVHIKNLYSIDGMTPIEMKMQSVGTTTPKQG